MAAKVTVTLLDGTHVVIVGGGAQRRARSDSSDRGTLDRFIRKHKPLRPVVHRQRQADDEETQRQAARKAAAEHHLRRDEWRRQKGDTSILLEDRFPEDIC